MNTTDTAFSISDEDDFSDEYDFEEVDRRVPAWVTVGLIPGLILVVAIYLEIALAIDARVLGAIPNFVLVVLVALALRFGPAWGAAIGFASGLLIDIAIQAPLGMSSLVLTPIGWGVGVFAGRRRRVSLAMAVTVVFVAAIICTATDVIVATTIDNESIAWSTVVISGTAGVMFTLLAGIVLLPVLRRLMGVPARGGA
ncbi:MAG: rod shape-determining protein MreD [Thermoleophilia bacterium]